MSLVVSVIAPTGRDAELITAVLEQHGIPARIGKTDHLPFEELAEELVGPLLIAEEALSPAFIQRLTGLLQGQAAWSDLPILILTGSGRETVQSNRLGHERLSLGSPILLERPIRTATLVSSVKAALRARLRQYEIKDALALLKEERETLQVVLDNLPVGVVLANAAGEIILGNKRLDAIVRHHLIPTPDTEAHGHWIAYHADGSQVKGEEFPLPRAMKAGHSLPAEDYLYERGDGTRAWVSLAAAPIFNEEGTVTGGVVTVSDIDHQKRAESALIQSEKLAAVGRLAASISHEINNPLEAVTNLLYLARQSNEIPEDARKYLDTADKELLRVSQIVSQTLRFHRQSTKARAISAQELLEPTLGLYSGRLSNSNIDLILQYRSVSLVTCFEGEIRQVLNNLVGNAIESMRNGGRLVVRTCDSHCWRHYVPGVRITIADTGHGMDRAVVRRIFEAFYTTKGINGTGLGLWISRGIVEKHHGLLHVHSSDNPQKSGTVFSLFLPATAPKLPPTTPIYRPISDVDPITALERVTESL